jgi:hypothetical protein
MKSILSLIISTALVVSGYSQTRNVLVGTNNAVVQPTNFWSADASNARTGLGLGTSATNSASAFQPSSSALTNLSANNGGSLTNLAASNVVGTLSLGQGGTGSTNASDARAALGLGTAATNPASAFQSSSPVLSNLAISNGAALTNISATNIVGVIPSSNIPSVTFTNFSGTLSIAQGGTGSTNAANARQNLGSTTVGDAVFVATNSEAARTALGATSVGSSVFTAIDASAARTSLGLGTASTNSSSVFQPSSAILSNLATGNGVNLTNITATIVGTNISITNVSGLQAVLDGKLSTNGSAAGLTSFPTIVLQTNSVLSIFPEGLLRTNGSAIGLTNFPVIPVTSGGTGGTNAQTARNGIGLGATNTLTIAGLVSQNITIESGGGITLQAVLTNAGSFRTNIGLPWSGLTNSDAASFRTELGLGTAATNASSAFQPSSSALTNISSGNGGSLTNLQATNLVGIIPASNISTVTLSNIGGTLPIAQGGTGATNTVNARASLGSTVVGDALFVATNAASARTVIGGTTIGSSVFTLANPSAITFLRLNADNTASALSDVNFRAAIGLGTASTNPSSAFQASSANLTNLALNNGGSLTNIVSSNIVGTLGLNRGGTGATNASEARTALELGTAATNASSNFQPSSLVLSNLALSNGGNLTNIPVVGVVGALSTNGSAAGLTNFPASLLTTNGNGAGLTNLTAANITGTVGLASNVTGTIALSNGGSGAINAGGARTNLGLGATNNAFSALSVGNNITNASTASDASSAFGNQITIDSTVENSLAVGFSHSMSNFGNQAGGSVLLGGIGTMTNWGAFLFNGVPQGGTAASSRGNSTFAVNASNGIYLNGPVLLEAIQGSATDSGILQIGSGGNVTRTMTNKSTATPAFFGWDGFLNTAFSAAQARTNIGLSFAALTNTNTTGFNASLYGSGTNPVLYNTNGEVVSPTNFWQQAPIATTVAFSAPATNSTNTATNSRNLIIQSLSSNIINTTNTLLLPTNTSTFSGDTAVVIHAGGSGSATAIRQTGSATNLIVLTNLDHAVRFLYFNNTWDFYHNLAYVEPIYFSGTNAAELAAASRTNLGLGATNEVAFGGIVLRDGDALKSEAAGDGDLLIGAVNTIFSGAIGFNNTTNAATTRTNLGIPLPALTNTNNANFQAAVFATNSNPTNAGNFNNHVAWMDVTIQTNGSNVSFRVPLYK